MSRPQRKYQLVVGGSSSARGSAAVHTGDDDMTSVSDLSHPSRQDVTLPPNIQAAIALTLTFKENITASVQFDYCDIAACGVQDLRFWRSDQYLCSTTNRCGPGVRFGKPVEQYGCDCEEAEWKFAHTGRWKSSKTGPKPGLQTRLTMRKKRYPDLAKCGGGLCNPLIITLENPELGDSGLYVLKGGTYDIESPQGVFKIVVKPSANKQESTADQVGAEADTSWKGVVRRETGFSESNLWLQWVQYTATNMQYSTDCIVCSQPRPMPTPVRSRFRPISPIFKCILELFVLQTQPVHHTCLEFQWDYPPATLSTPPPFMVPDGTFDCIVSEIMGRIKVGDIAGVNCTTVQFANVTRYSSVLNQTISRADLWWWCGTKVIYPTLPANWTGTCALVQLIMPFYVFPVKETTFQDLISPHPHVARRAKRSTSPAGSFDSHVYLDAIGVPRGVPDEFKARNQIASGIESFFFWWVTINKNIDWINYIYYNQQRFINFTRDAITGLHEQLDKTSLMAWQNRMALDMILAEKGGVCRMFGSACCTFIPNNTAPDGSESKALAGLTARTSSWQTTKATTILSPTVMI
uniref:Uncharacterized protein n=1 Tax=Gasterosteus aculeatus aculeatus TaxID=481459 RepID=A0AAQ4QJR7_GASAC|nr:uncharacterized protein LOC120813135 [Gasterosteus aculeatus aculeatus]